VSDETAIRPAWAVVAGGDGSIGRPIAEHLAANGWRVLSLDRAASHGSQANLITRAVDAMESSAVEQALDDAIPSREPIKLLVNAIGLIWNEPFLSVRDRSFQAHRLDTWRQVIDANLTAPFVVASKVVTRMARGGGGAIVNFSSIAARGNAGQPAYSAAKAGIEGLTRAMASELGPLGIRVNAIAPGFVDVPSTRAALNSDQLSAITDRTPSRRLGTVNDIIVAIEFLVESSFVNGIVLDVNGGCRL
jgi:3-oxoacyl-[acyl-carrier protein] reductase